MNAWNTNATIENKFYMSFKVSVWEGENSSAGCLMAEAFSLLRGSQNFVLKEESTLNCEVIITGFFFFSVENAGIA